MGEGHDSTMDLMKGYQFANTTTFNYKNNNNTRGQRGDSAAATAGDDDDDEEEMDMGGWFELQKLSGGNVTIKLLPSICQL